MKTLFYVFVVVLSVFVQTSFFPALGLVGIMPDMVLLVLVCVSMLEGSIGGLVAGLCAGLLLDVAVMPDMMGFHSIPYGLVGFLIGLPRRQIIGDKFLFPFVIGFLAFVLKDMMQMLLLFFLQHAFSFWEIFIKTTLLSALWTGVFLIPLIAGMSVLHKKWFIKHDSNQLR